MTFIEDWNRVLRRAWSVRLIVLAAGLSGAEFVLPLLGDHMPPGLLALLSAIASSGAFAARFLVQKDLDDGT